MTRRARSPFLIAALLLLPLGCQWGTRPKSFPPALAPVGASVAFRLNGDRFDRFAELMAVDSAGVLLELRTGTAARDSSAGSSPTLVRVPWRSLRLLDVDKVGADYDVAPGARPSAERIARIRLLSRFPFGVNDAVMAQLLARARQSSVVELTETRQP